MRTSLAAWLRDRVAARPLRPPGALDEPRFAARCVRCGRCASVCPYDALKPAGWGWGAEAGTPLLVAREEPCWLCMRCPPVCPTGALAPVADRRAVRMGRARVVQERCFAYQGILCRTCIDECPFEGEAIRPDADYRPIVTDRCVGCGICEHRCPAGGSAIVIVPGSPP